MTVQLTETLSQITALPVQDQIELLHHAWDCLVDSGWEPELTDAQKSDIDHRLDDPDSNPQNTVSLEKLIEHVRRPR